MESIDKQNTFSPEDYIDTDLRDQKDSFPIEEYIDIVLRRKWLIIIPFVLSIIIIAGVYHKLPKIYRSDTLILVIPQTVPKEYVRPTVTYPIEARIATMTEEILSRTRLETILNEINIYSEEREIESIQNIISRMRRDIEIKTFGNQRQGENISFRIYFKGKDPETVKAVTNKLASLFIEENLKIREQQARITTDFLDKEMISAKKKLQEQEKIVSEFKLKHIGNLPEQYNANLEMLGQLIEQRQIVNENIGRSEDKRFSIQQQLSNMGQYLDDRNPNSLQNRLQTARNELQVLKGIYTDNHIEVQKLQERIKQLEKDLTSEKIEKDPAFLELKDHLLTTNKEIERLNKEDKRIRQQIVLYEKKVEDSPFIEVQLASITRDYNNTREFYEELLKKKMEAEQAENLEKRQQGEQFKILDPASLPIVPFKPNPKKIFPIGIFLGLGIGCGLAFLAEMLDKSLKNVKDVEKHIGVPVLAMIPLIEKKKKVNSIS